ncbi:DUF484 family protein [Vibrio sp. DNF-1]|nr:DUF484 family protein [Vibrio salinus]MCE0493552.1 DUF484 family protein [Vibrio salinus]
MLTDDMIEQYLREHPDFFYRRPELVDRLTLPRPDDGAVSLVHLQLNRQRVRIEELEEEITTLMSLAASNDLTFHAFMDLQGKMLGTRCVVESLEAIYQTAQDLNLRSYVRFIDAPDDSYRIDRLNFQRFTTNHFNGKQAFLGRLKKVDRDALFGEASRAPEFGSYAVLSLSTQLGHGIMAFSSDDGGHFQPCMDTLFLRHLAVVLTYLVDTLPWRA